MQCAILAEDLDRLAAAVRDGEVCLESPGFETLNPLTGLRFRARNPRTQTSLALNLTAKPKAEADHPKRCTLQPYTLDPQTFGIFRVLRAREKRHLVHLTHAKVSQTG